MSLRNLGEFRDILVPLLDKLGVDSEIIYVFIKTGLLVSEANSHLISDDQLSAVNKATTEYRLLLAEMATKRH